MLITFSDYMRMVELLGNADSNDKMLIAELIEHAQFLKNQYLYKRWKEDQRQIFAQKRGDKYGDDFRYIQ